MFKAAGPLMPKCVHSIEPPMRVVGRTVDAKAQCHVVGDAGKRHVSIAVEHERGQRRRGLDACVPESAREMVSEAVAPGLWQRASTSRKHHALRVEVAPRRRFRRRSRDAARRSRSRAGQSREPRQRDSLRQQRVEHGSRPIGVRKQLAVFLFVQRDAKRFEERCRRDRLETRVRRCRTTREDPPQKSRSVTTRLVTLHRDPPLTRIFAPIFVAPSRHRTSRSGAARLAKIAVARPAAPAPTTMTVTMVGGSG
jgi:hypothetical protein